MGELGERLRTAREAKELTLEQVAEGTRIPVNSLQALEQESFTGFTSDLHARGFLRNYASYLGLDPDEISELYALLRGKPVPKRKVLLSEAPARSGRTSTLLADALLALVLVAVLTLGGLSIHQFRLQREATPTAGPLSTPTATPMPVFEGTEYTLDVHLNYADHRLDVRERIDYTNVTSETLTNLVLNIHPNHSRGAFKLNDIRVDVDGELVPPLVTPLDVTLRVELPRELKARDHVALFLNFTLNLPQISPDAEFSDAGFGYSKRSISLGNWYPVLAPYRGDKGWYALTYFPVGDPYVTEVADYQVTITATEGIVIAGSGKETLTGNVWRYEVEKARSFAFAASDRYQVSSTQAGDVRLTTYTFPDNQAAAEAVLQTGSQAIQLFDELYGPYPYGDYRVAETEFAGGLEFTGLTFLGSAFFDQYDGTSRNALIPLTAHEVSHQWFYGIVGSDQITEPWLDESIAEYSAYLYYERILPGDADWWWNFAVDQWAPGGRIDSLIYEFRDNRGYVDAVYRRGAQFIRDLRKTMGDPAFFDFLREYQRRHAYRLVTSKDFFELVREYTTADLVQLQEEYFRQRILP